MSKKMNVQEPSQTASSSILEAVAQLTHLPAPALEAAAAVVSAHTLYSPQAWLLLLHTLFHYDSETWKAAQQLKLLLELMDERFLTEAEAARLRPVLEVLLVEFEQLVRFIEG
jgi:hypothetical protein